MKLDKYVFQLSFLLSTLLSTAAFAKGDTGGGSTRGNSGGSRHLEEFLGPLQISMRQASAINMEDNVQKFFQRDDNLACDIVQNYLSLSIGLLQFYRDSGFEFKDRAGQRIDLAKVDFAALRAKYTEPANCVDRALDNQRQAPVEIVDSAPPAGYDADVMAINYPDTGRLILYRKNWKSSEVLKRETCRSLGDDALTQRRLQRGCLFATHLAVSMHELLALGGIAQEKTGSFEVSSQFSTLVTLNLAKPDPRAVRLIEHLARHYLQAFRGVQVFDEREAATAQKLTTKERLAEKELGAAFAPWRETFIDLNLIASRFRVVYFNINIIFEFIIPEFSLSYRKFFPEYRAKYLVQPQPRLGYTGLIRDSYVAKLGEQPFVYESMEQVQRLFFEFSFFSDLVLGETYESSADIYEMNPSLDIDTPIQSHKTAEEIKDWKCVQFPGLNGKLNKRRDDR